VRPAANKWYYVIYLDLGMSKAKVEDAQPVRVLPKKASRWIQHHGPKTIAVMTVSGRVRVLDYEPTYSKWRRVFIPLTKHERTFIPKGLR